MSVRIRLKRVGAKNSPAYRVVVTHNKGPRDGKFIEEIGTYQPIKKEDKFAVNQERVDYWLKQGAQPSDTVASYLRRLKRTAAAAAVA